MKQEYKEPWLIALRSGEFKQGRGCLMRKDKDGFSYCCLGVLDEVTDCLRGFVGISIKDRVYLARMNDFYLKDFNEIADYIEANL